MQAPPYPLIPPLNANTPPPPAHIAAPAPFGPTPSLIPGPFILLLLLPSIPLLLFSLGARPPDTSHLPFSTSDVFATGAFVTVAGIVVLCLGVYPETGQAVLEWIKDGNANGWHMTSQFGSGEGSQQWPWPWKWDWLDGKATSISSSGSEQARLMVDSAVRGEGMGKAGLNLARKGGQGGLPIRNGAGLIADTAAHAETEWRFDPSIKRWVKVAVRPAVQAQVPTNSRNIHSLASKHLTALRNAYPRYFSTSKPPLIASLLIIAFLIFLLTLLVGAILNSAYDAETSFPSSKRPSSGSGSGSGSSSSSSSRKLPSWAERELRKRKAEKPEDSIKRMNAEEKKEVEAAKKKGTKELDKFIKKREADKAVLVKELKKRKMPLAGLKDEGSSKDKDKNKNQKKDGEDKTGDDGKEKAEDGEGEGEGEKKEKSSKGKKIRKFLLGEKAGEGGADGKKKDATQGPGWEIADPTLAQATLAKSGADAQNAAERLKAGG
ncbi:hypothetical protein IAT40_001388 [Kwoniella sp. CBS 6097]